MADVSTVTRSFVLGSDGVTYFEVIRTTYDDETYSEQSSIVGPADQLVNHYKDDFVNKTTTMANNAFPVAKVKSFLNELEADDADILAITGTSPKIALQDANNDFLFTDNTWEIDDGVAGFLPLVFSVNASNVLKYAIDGGATSNAHYWGGIIELNNFPESGTRTQFFVNRNGRRFLSLPNGNAVIKRTPA